MSHPAVAVRWTAEAAMRAFAQALDVTHLLIAGDGEPCRRHAPVVASANTAGVAVMAERA